MNHSHPVPTTDVCYLSCNLLSTTVVIYIPLLSFCLPLRSCTSHGRLLPTTMFFNYHYRHFSTIVIFYLPLSPFIYHWDLLSTNAVFLSCDLLSTTVILYHCDPKSATVIGYLSQLSVTYCCDLLSATGFFLLLFPLISPNRLPLYMISKALRQLQYTCI